MSILLEVCFDSTGVHEIHANASVASDDCQSLGEVMFGTHRRVASVELLRAIKQSLASGKGDRHTLAPKTAPQ